MTLVDLIKSVMTLQKSVLNPQYQELLYVLLLFIIGDL